MTASTIKLNSRANTNAEGPAGFPPAPPEARQQAGARDAARNGQGGQGGQGQAARHELPSLIGFAHLPIPVRCAVEWFLNDGPRTQQRLLDLIEHFLRSSGLVDCEERELYTDSAIAHVKRVASLGAEEGFR